MRQAQQRPIHYCGVCHGIEPIVVKSPRDFLVAQGVVAAVAAAIFRLAS